MNFMASFLSNCGGSLRSRLAPGFNCMARRPHNVCGLTSEALGIPGAGGVMRRVVLVVAVCLQVSAYATSKEVFLSDGSKGYRISCDGMVLSAGDCLEKAGAIC